MPWRTGPLSASCDRMGQTPNCERAQTCVEQRIVALALLAKATLLLREGVDGIGRPTPAHPAAQAGKRPVRAAPHKARRGLFRAGPPTCWCLVCGHAGLFRLLVGAWWPPL